MLLFGFLFSGDYKEILLKWANMVQTLSKQYIFSTPTKYSEMNLNMGK